VFKLLTEGGAMAVIGLYHPPKYSDKETDLTLENSVLGSAGYGGILRSCLAVRNLNADLNDEKLRLYVQGLKNPRLKPFQLAGLPLTMSVRPGESPYLSGIVRDQKQNKQHQQKQERQMQVLELLKQGNSVRGIAEKLKISHNTVRAIRDEFEDE
jgi:DNA-binding CsgD family transcriptional regulator